MEQFDLAARTSYGNRHAAYGAQSLFENLRPDEILSFLDWAVFDNAEGDGDSSDNDVLEEILIAGGSLWKVGQRDGVAGLERRVPKGVQQAAEQVMSTPGHAGTLLSEAWHAAFGLNPDFGKAYAQSVKAVEAAAIPVVSPNDAGATLGKVIGTIRADGNWSLDLTREHLTSTSAAVILGMAQALWTGQSDRHAGPSDYGPSTRADAEAAVFLAVPLVQFFSSGAVARR